jgi:peptidyl-prolyl cis-trans isomerase C
LGEEMKLSHILTDHEYEIQDIQKLLKEGESFADLAKRFSKCPSGASGGSLGEISKGQTVKEFEDAAFALSSGDISEPVKTQFGFHLIQRDD